MFLIKTFKWNYHTFTWIYMKLVYQNTISRLYEKIIGNLSNVHTQDLNDFIYSAQMKGLHQFHIILQSMYMKFSYTRHIPSYTLQQCSEFHGTIYIQSFWPIYWPSWTEQLKYFFDRFAQENDLIFLETSAKTGESVEEAFLKCSKTILAKIETGYENETKATAILNFLKASPKYFSA